MYADTVRTIQINIVAIVAAVAATDSSSHIVCVNQFCFENIVGQQNCLEFVC